MGKYGKYANDGSVEVEATECMLTGRTLAAPYDNTVRYSVKGASQFFRILSSQAHRVTDEMLAEWRGDTLVSIDENAPAVETFTVGFSSPSDKTGGKSKRDKWGVDTVVSSEFDTGNEAGQ